MGRTEENLKAAFAGESQANRKYLAFAKKAEEEEFPNIAKLFRAVAEAETVHAHNHLRILKMIRSTKENLQAALNGEIYEFTDMYPDFIKIATQEGINDATLTFNYANQVEKIHGGLYKKAIESVEQNKDIEEKEFFVCQVCGYTAEGEAPNTCPICGASKEEFKKIL
ncbi:MAG: rubrerythrin family protein [Candidatus Aenigmarchaeota archaeon]|nr:rubrerythrin family protein [Candidatus Aenigmarchaeota archaeon]